MNNKILIISICLIAIFLSVFVYYSKPNPYFQTMKINDQLLNVEVVSNHNSLRIGLSKYEELSDKQAMLFVFPASDFNGIWMKDMNFSIDIIWLDDNLQIVDIIENIAPDSYPEVFYPQTPVKYVLELKAGQVNNLNINKGDYLLLSNEENK